MTELDQPLVAVMAPWASRTDTSALAEELAALAHDIEVKTLLARVALEVQRVHAEWATLPESLRDRLITVSTDIPELRERLSQLTEFGVNDGS